MPRVFISHSHKDFEYVEREIIRPLKATGVDVFYAPDDVRAGHEWERQIADALDSCEWFVVAITKNAAESKWVRWEVNLAMEENDRRVIGLRIDETEPKRVHLGLFSVQNLAFAIDPGESRKRLLALWGVEVSVSTATPTESESPYRYCPYCGKPSDSTHCTHCSKDSSFLEFSGSSGYKFYCVYCGAKDWNAGWCKRCGKKGPKGKLVEPWGYCTSCGAHLTHFGKEKGIRCSECNSGPGKAPGFSSPKCAGCNFSRDVNDNFCRHCGLSATIEPYE